MNIRLSDTLGGIAAQDYRMAAPMRELGLEYSFCGHLTLKKACENRGLSPRKVLFRLKSAIPGESIPWPEYGAWSETGLIRHIVRRHHGYLRSRGPVLLALAEKLRKKQGKVSQEIVEIEQILQELMQTMMRHIEKEESELFPAIEAAIPGGDKISLLRLKMAVTIDESEHLGERGHLQILEKLLKNLERSESRGLFQKTAIFHLHEFIEDMHLHIHLENNILFPKIKKHLQTMQA